MYNIHRPEPACSHNKIQGPNIQDLPTSKTAPLPPKHGAPRSPDHAPVRQERGVGQWTPPPCRCKVLRDVGDARGGGLLLVVAAGQEAVRAVHVVFLGRRVAAGRVLLLCVPLHVVCGQQNPTSRYVMAPRVQWRRSTTSAAGKKAKHPPPLRFSAPSRLQCAPKPPEEISCMVDCLPIQDVQCRWRV